MLTRPILNKIFTFDANQAKKISFEVIGGSQVFGNNLVITRIRDGVIVYDGEMDLTELNHILPAGVLMNSEEYKANIRWRDINNNWSLFSSNIIIFKCYSKPIINILNIDSQNKVYNQTVIFSASYFQTEDEPLQSYRYLLYNSNKNLMHSYPEKLLGEDEFLTQEIAGLENDVIYYLEVITFSPNENKGSSGLINFKPQYVAPRVIANVDPYAVPELGAIKIDANIIQVLLKLYDSDGNEIMSDDVVYEDGEWIDLNSLDYDKLVADKGFYILQENFVLQLWCKDLPENTVFMTIFSSNGQIELLKRNNKIVAYKKINTSNICGYFGSNDFVAVEEDILYLYMRQISGSIDLEVGILSE